MNFVCTKSRNDDEKPIKFEAKCKITLKQNKLYTRTKNVNYKTEERQIKPKGSR